MLKKIKKNILKKQMKGALPPEVIKCFQEFKNYQAEGKNLFMWLTEQPLDFLNKLTEGDPELINPDYPLNYGMFLVLICLKSYEMENGVKQVPEEELVQMSQELAALCSVASLVKAGFILAKEESKWFKMGSSVQTSIVDRNYKPIP